MVLDVFQMKVVWGFRFDASKMRVSPRGAACNDFPALTTPRARSSAPRTCRTRLLASTFAQNSSVWRTPNVRRRRPNRVLECNEPQLEAQAIRSRSIRSGIAANSLRGSASWKFMNLAWVTTFAPDLDSLLAVGSSLKIVRCGGTHLVIDAAKTECQNVDVGSPLSPCRPGQNSSFGPAGAASAVTDSCEAKVRSPHCHIATFFGIPPRSRQMEFHFPERLSLPDVMDERLFHGLVRLSADHLDLACAQLVNAADHLQFARLDELR